MPSRESDTIVGSMRDVVGGPREVFLVEAFAPAPDEDGFSGMANRVRAVCADLLAAGADVVYLGALIVPHDELAFHLISADDADVVLEASKLAGLRVERVVPSVAIGALATLPTRRDPLRMSVEPVRSVAHEPREIGS